MMSNGNNSKLPYKYDNPSKYTEVIIKPSNATVTKIIVYMDTD